MSTTKTWAGSTYNLPLNREPKSSGWGTEVSNFLIALADNAISKTGGTYNLTAELNLGATYGILAPYLKSASSNIASAGVVRLANLETIKWRNAANSADVSLSVNASDRLTVDGVVVPTVSSTDTVTNKTLTAPTINSGVLSGGTIDNAIIGGTNPAAGTFTSVTATSATVGGSAVTTAANSQTLTNKTLTSPTLTTPALGTPASGVMTNVTGLPLTTAVTGTLPVANGGTGVTTSTGTGSTVLSSAPTLASPAMTGALTITEGSAPSNPAAGKVALYAKTDNRLYLLDSGGTESPAGAGLTPTYKAANFTAVAGSNYLVNTTSGALTATLPAGSSFATIRFTDDLGTWGGTGTTLTITPAGAETIQGVSGSLVCNVAGSWVELNWDPTNGKWIYSTNGYASTVGPTTVVVPGSSAGLVSSSGLTGNTTGSAIAAGYVGEIVQLTGSGGAWGLTSVADTWTDASAMGTIALTAGIWQIGYSVPMRVANATGSAAAIGGNVCLYDGSANVAGSISIFWPYIGAANDVTMQASQTVFVNLTSSKTYSLKTRCTHATATGACSIQTTDVTGSLTNPDTSPRLWAVRIA